MKGIGIIVILAAGIGLVSGQCPEKTIWRLFPDRAELGDVEAPGEAAQNLAAIPGGKSYSMEWPLGVDTRAANIRLLVFDSLPLAEQEYAKKIKLLKSSRPVPLGDRGCAFGPPIQPNWLILRKNVLIEYETFYYPDKTVADQSMVLQNVVSRLDRLECLIGPASPPVEPSVEAPARGDSGGSASVGGEMDALPTNGTSPAKPDPWAASPAGEVAPALASPPPTGAEPPEENGSPAPAAGPADFFAVYRPARRERVVVKGFSGIQEGDQVLGGPLDYYAARRLTEQEPVAVPEASPRAVEKVSPPEITGVTQGLILSLTMDEEGPGLLRGPLGPTGRVFGEPVRLKTRHGWGLEFDGRNDRIIMEPDAALDLRGSMTIEVLAKLPRVLREEDLHMMVWRGDLQGGKDPYGFSISRNYLVFRRDFPKHVEVMWPLKNLDPELFHVFCAVHRAEQGLMEIWVDGERVSAGHVKEQMKYKTEGMSTEIGAQDNGQSQFFRGVIDEVRIFNRALSPFEIATEAKVLLE